MFYVNSEICLNRDLDSPAVSVDNYPQKRKRHLTITYIIHLSLHNYTRSINLFLPMYLTRAKQVIVIFLLAQDDCLLNSLYLILSYGR